MSDFDDYEIANYEVGYNKNDQSHIIYVGSDLEEATFIYERAIETHCTKDNINHIIVYLYDYEKQCNLNYFNNYDEIC